MMNCYIMIRFYFFVASQVIIMDKCSAWLNLTNLHKCCIKGLGRFFAPIKQDLIAQVYTWQNVVSNVFFGLVFFDKQGTLWSVEYYYLVKTFVLYLFFSFACAVSCGYWGGVRDCRSEREMVAEWSLLHSCLASGNKKACVVLYFCL